MTWTVIAEGGWTDRPPDLDEVRRALRVLLDPHDAHELRGLPSGRSRPLRADDPDAALAAVAELADDRGLYYTLNPVRPGLGHRAARVADVTRRRWLLVDIDRRKAPGDSDRSATDAERTATTHVADAVLTDLAGRGWPAPVLIDSGNGVHLLWRVDLPNDPLSGQLLSACLRALATAHDTDAAEIDRKVHNASRVAKLPGTWARKGPDAPDAPHRLCRFLHVPADVEVVPVEALKALAAPPPESAGGEVHANGAGWTVRATNGEHDAYIRSAFERELARVALAPEGDRNNVLNDAAFRLGMLLPAGLDRGTAEDQLALAASRAGLGETEVRATIRSGLDAGLLHPRTLPDRNGTGHSNGHANGRTNGHHAAPDRGQADEGPLTILGSDVEPLAVRWLWPDRIALGFITVFAGRTGVGKSFVMCDLIARLTTGRALPEGGGPLPRSGALFISEDPYEYMLVPRLIESGADLDAVRFLRWEAMARYTLDDVDFLERAWLESGEPAIVVIDPPTNFLKARDEHKNSEVRQVLMGLVGWLKGRDVACVLITHVKKASEKGIDALARVIGSVAWTTTARIAHAFTPDPQGGRCLFLPLKNNLGPMPGGLAYRIEPTDSLARVDWLGPVEMTADEAMAAVAPPTRKVQASDWLVERFREQRSWPSEDLFARAEKDGVSRSAIFEAKKALDLPKARRVVTEDGSQWTWWVPDDWPPLCGPQ